MYIYYIFEMIPIIIVAFGIVLNDFKTSLRNLNFDKKRKRVLLENCKL